MPAESCRRLKDGLPGFLAAVPGGDKGAFSLGSGTAGTDGTAGTFLRDGK